GGAAPRLHGDSAAAGNERGPVRETSRLPPTALARPRTGPPRALLRSTTPRQAHLGGVADTRPRPGRRDRPRAAGAPRPAARALRGGRAARSTIPDTGPGREPGRHNSGRQGRGRAPAVVPAAPRRTGSGTRRARPLS